MVASWCAFLRKSVRTISAGDLSASFSCKYSARICCRQSFWAACKSRGRSACSAIESVDVVSREVELRGPQQIGDVGSPLRQPLEIARENGMGRAGVAVLWVAWARVARYAANSLMSDCKSNDRDPSRSSR